MNKFIKISKILFLLFFLYSCGSVGEALQGKKRSDQGDEFLIDKKNPFNPITTSLNQEEYSGKSLVLIDDVLHTGTTLIYGVNHFLKVPLKLFKTAVLVNRNHKKYPVKADFKGISLSTSMQENVEVFFDSINSKVTLH